MVAALGLGVQLGATTTIQFGDTEHRKPLAARNLRWGETWRGGVPRLALELRKFFGTLFRSRNPKRLLLVIVKVARVSGSFASRHERRLDLLLEHGDPVGRRKPLVSLDIVNARLQITIALRQIHLQEVAQQILQITTEMRRKANLARHDLLVNLYRLIGKERRITGRHFVDEHSERPPVHRFIVALAQNDLRRQILGRAAQRPGPSLHAFRKPEIRHLQVALVVDQQVLRLQIPIDQVQIVQILKGEHNLGGIEARMGLREAADLAQMREHLTARHVLEDHVEIGVVLEVILEADEKRKGDGLQDAFLVQRVLDLLEFDDLLLVEDLHCVIVFGRFVLDDHDATERTGAQCLDAIEIVQRRCVGRIALPFVLKLLLGLVEEFLDAFGGVHLLVGRCGVVAHCEEFCGGGGCGGGGGGGAGFRSRRRRGRMSGDEGEGGGDGGVGRSSSRRGVRRAVRRRGQ